MLGDVRLHVTNEGTGDLQIQGTTMLELYSFEIQMYQETHNLHMVKVRCNIDTKETYHSAMSVKNAIPHPRTMGVIREYGGKMHMTESKWLLLTQKTGRPHKLISFRRSATMTKPEALSVFMCLSTLFLPIC